MLEVYNQPRVRLPLSRERIAAIVRLVEKNLRQGRIEGEAVFTAPRSMQALNRTYRGKNYATDVLSFALDEQVDWPGERAKKTSFTVQLYLCPAVIKKQARRFKVPEREECARMIIHGLLHAAGYDHMVRAEAVTMFTLQETILARFLSPRSRRPLSVLTKEEMERRFVVPHQ